MSISRRSFFSNLGKSVAYLAVLSSLPRIAWAKWNIKAFTAPNLDAAIKINYGDLPIVDSDLVKLKAPAIAENGAVVPITVESKLANTKSISLFVPDNPGPLVVKFNLGPSSVAKIKTRIRMGKTSEVIALVEADGKLHRARQAVKVTIGGCGG
ncbi:MAG: thiosulfate oxidation carrier protein SoxY [Gammaproteobacteria bacterium]|nr:MAG: thiosulfate oxidation carrier protein SoxY [Gammaproteobacteria bacterium]